MPPYTSMFALDKCSARSRRSTEKCAFGADCTSTMVETACTASHYPREVPATSRASSAVTPKTKSSLNVASLS